MFTPTYPQPSAVALRDYNTRINKQILPDNTTITEWHVSDINGLNAVANVTTNAGVNKTIPIVRKDLSTLFPANEAGYHVVDARWYDKFSGAYDGGQSQVIKLLDDATRLNHTVGYTPDARLEHALAWLWIKKQIYIPITDVTVSDIRTDEWVVNHGVAESKSILDAYTVTARDDSLGFVGSVKLVFSAVPAVEGFEFTVISPAVENVGARFALVLDQTATDWTVYENDQVVVSLATNTIGATITNIPGKSTVVFNNLKNTTKTYVVKATGGTLSLENHVATTRNIVIKSFVDTVSAYLFKLPTVDLTVPETLPRHITSLSGMFSGCSYFNQDISMWDTSNVTDMNTMFSGCVAFNQPVGSWDVSNVNLMSNLFYGCRAFNQPLNDWNVSSSTNMSFMFYDCKVFNQPLNDWNVSSSTNMSFMFCGCSIFNQPLNAWNVSRVIDITGMFSGCTVFNRPIGNWDVSRVTTFNSLFSNAVSFNQPLNDWNVSSVKNMTFMFAGAKSFNQDLDRWNTINVTDMSVMFGNSASAFNGNISTWNTSKVIVMTSMFSGAIIFNGDISMWNVSSVTSMHGMFTTARSFNQPIGNWNTSNVTIMSRMFSNASAFNQPIGNWNTSNVTDMSYMFYNAKVFNQDISAWNVSKVTSMLDMFQGTNLFNKDISTWDVSQVTNMSNLFWDATAFNQDLSDWCVSKIVTAPTNFSTPGNTWTLPKPVWGTCPIRVPKTMPFSFNVVSSNDWVTNNNITLTLTAPVAGWSLKRDNIVVASATVITTPGIVVTTTGGNVTIVIEALRNETRSFEMAISATQVQMSYTANQPGMTVAVTSFSDAVAGYRLNVNALLTVPTVLPISVTSTANMFGGARKFNQDISMWDTSRVTNMSSMFNNAWLFNMPLNTWNTSNVTTMNSMFYSAKVFNQDIGSWNVSKVADMNFFATDTAFNRDLSQWCVPLLDSAPSGFSVAAIHVLPKPVWGTCPRGENVAL